MESASTRQQKVARQIQKDLGEIIQTQGMATYKGAMISVTEVRVSSDLAMAKIFLSIFPSDKAKDTMQLINANNKTIRGELGKRVRYQLRIVPELSFFIDDSLDRLQHIDDLLNQ
ncbi:MAG: 30S ribosome-binding factor RbfA [Prevotellaceae bacterium]|jgi:ribosome-binding factor A|nr:30S ribosome-binding factor RbfA [Prevotellaceae bacterium]